MARLGPLLLLAACASVCLGVRRIHKERGGPQACVVKEREGEVQYGVSFRFFHRGGGCKPCNTFNFFTELLPLIVIGEDGHKDGGMTQKVCSCWAGNGEGRKDGERFLFSYLKNQVDTCDSATCWDKMSNVMFLHRKSLIPGGKLSPQQRMTSLNHWDVGCGEVTDDNPIGIVLPSVSSLMTELKQHGKHDTADDIGRLATVKEEMDEEEVNLQSAVQDAAPVVIAYVVTDVAQAGGDSPSGGNSDAEDLDSVVVDFVRADQLVAKTWKLRQVIQLEKGGQTCSKNANKFARDSSASCGPIETPEDCRTAANQLGIEEKGAQFHVFNRPQTNYPGRCSVRYQKTGPKHVWWNDDTNERSPKKIGGGKRSVGWGLICGCYEEVSPKPTVDVPETPEPRLVQEKPDKPAKEVTKPVQDPITTCEAEADEASKAACLCQLADGEATSKEQAKQCTAFNVMVKRVAAPWGCAHKRFCSNKRCTKKEKKCVAFESWR